jgi:hypothetical protein
LGKKTDESKADKLEKSVEKATAGSKSKTAKTM